MKAEALFWRQCTEAVAADGSIDAQRLMQLVIATYRGHESDYDAIEKSAETLLKENQSLRGNLSALSQAFDGQKRLFEIVLNNLPLGLSVFDADQRLTLYNSRFHQLFGLTPGGYRRRRNDYRAPRKNARQGKRRLTRRQANRPTCFRQGGEQPHPPGANGR